MGLLNVVPSVGVEDGPVTGSGLSKNGNFSYGYASSGGKRSSMEDFLDTRIDVVDGETVGLFGVFDVDAYRHTDSELLKIECNQSKDAGSTSSTAILMGRRLLVANVGDSRAVISRDGNAIAVTRDHKPNQSDERRRIEAAGGFVMWAGTWRVGGVLAVSRAFGDKLLKRYVIADPEIQEEVIDKSLEFLIIASDGLWDVVSNEEAVALIKPIENPENAAKKLMVEAFQKGSADNITCIVVSFLAERGDSSSSNQ